MEPPKRAPARADSDVEVLPQRPADFPLSRRDAKRAAKRAAREERQRRQQEEDEEEQLQAAIAASKRSFRRETRKRFYNESDSDSELSD